MIQTTLTLAKGKWHLILLGALTILFAGLLIHNFYQGIEDKATMQALQEQNATLKQEKETMRVKYQEEKQRLQVEIARLYEEKQSVKDENRRIRNYNESLLNDYRTLTSRIEPRPDF